MTCEDFLPYGRQSIDEDDIAAVARVLRGDHLTTGPAVGAFETALAGRVGAPFAVACSSGTAGLHMATLALGLAESDVAVVPTLTFLATANAVRFTGARVVFADVDADTGLLTPETFEAALARSPRPPGAVLPVHLNGQPCDMAGLGAIARQHGIAVIEDAAHALGGTQATADGAAVPVGACADSAMTAFSFHAVKTVAMGEGGAVTTGDADLGERLARFRNHGMTRDPRHFRQPELALDTAGATNPWYYEMPEIGWNYRASDIHCALGLSQLAKLERFLARRADLADRYDRLLAPLAPIVRPVPRVAHGTSGWHLYVALIDFAAAGTARSRVMTELREVHRIGTQVHYIPVHLQPYYRAQCDTPELAGGRAYYDRILSLPLFPAMEDGAVDRVVSALAGVLGLEL